MNVGDLICYNAAGQKHKTLGMVYAFDRVQSGYGTGRPLVLIQWCVVGEIMPRTEWFGAGWKRDPIRPGEFIWHPHGDWFEVVK